MGRGRLAEVALREMASSRTSRSGPLRHDRRQVAELLVGLRQGAENQRAGAEAAAAARATAAARKAGGARQAECRAAGFLGQGQRSSRSGAVAGEGDGG